MFATEWMPTERGSTWADRQHSRPIIKREGTDHGAILECAVIRELVAQVSGDAIVPAERTVVRGRSGEDDIRAQLNELSEFLSVQGISKVRTS